MWAFEVLKIAHGKQFVSFLQLWQLLCWVFDAVEKGSWLTGFWLRLHFQMLFVLQPSKDEVEGDFVWVASNLFIFNVLVGDVPFIAAVRDRGVIEEMISLHVLLELYLFLFDCIVPLLVILATLEQIGQCKTEKMSKVSSALILCWSDLPKFFHQETWSKHDFIHSTTVCNQLKHASIQQALRHAEINVIVEPQTYSMLANACTYRKTSPQNFCHRILLRLIVPFYCLTQAPHVKCALVFRISLFSRETVLKALGSFPSVLLVRSLQFCLDRQLVFEHRTYRQREQNNQRLIHIHFTISNQFYQ